MGGESIHREGKAMPRFHRAIAPSILSADFSNFAQGVRSIQEAGADLVHIDVMDGHFVPNLTFGPQLVKDLRKCSTLPLDVHLMVSKPEDFVDEMAQAGADILTFHLEASTHAHRLVQRIREAGMAVGLSLVPSTPVSFLEELLDLVDIVLVMTVNPGFGGQSLIPSCLEKISLLREMRQARGLDYSISADGGAKLENRNLFWESGVDIIVSGTSFFSAEDHGAFVSAMRQ